AEERPHPPLVFEGAFERSARLVARECEDSPLAVEDRANGGEPPVAPNGDSRGAGNVRAERRRHSSCLREAPVELAGPPVPNESDRARTLGATPFPRRDDPAVTLNRHPVRLPTVPGKSRYDLPALS